MRNRLIPDKRINQRKLGIRKNGATSADNPFYNQFVSGPLSNTLEIDPVTKCEQLLAKVAMVRVEMTRSDAIQMERSIPASMATLTNTGGLLSLYAGFSFLSLAEIVFWVLRVSLRLLFCNKACVWSK